MRDAVDVPMVDGLNELLGSLGVRENGLRLVGDFVLPTRQVAGRRCAVKSRPPL